MVLTHSRALIVSSLLVLLVVAVVGVEQVLEFAHLGTEVHRFDVRISQLALLKLLLELLNLFAGLVVERVEQLLQPFLLG